jgi:hypothetical protein
VGRWIVMTRNLSSRRKIRLVFVESTAVNVLNLKVDYFN